MAAATARAAAPRGAATGGLRPTGGRLFGLGPCGCEGEWRNSNACLVAPFGSDRQLCAPLSNFQETSFLECTQSWVPFFDV